MNTEHTSTIKTTSSSHSIRTALAGLVALAVAMGVGRFAFTPIMPMMLTDAGLTLERAGWLASSNYVGYLIGAMIPVFIRARPEPMLRAGLILIGMATLAMAIGILLPAVWPNVVTVFAAALLVGATFMVITLVALQEAKLVTGNHATVLIAAMTCAFAIGQIVGPLMIRSRQEGGDDFSTGLIIASLLLACSTLLLKRTTPKLFANQT